MPEFAGSYDGLADALELAEAARDGSYAPHYAPQEGAVLVTVDGTGLVGSRVENSNYTNTRHAVESVFGDLLMVDEDPAYLVVSADAYDRSTFLGSKVDTLREFVDPQFPIIRADPEDPSPAAADQYTLGAVSEYMVEGALRGEEPDDVGGFVVEEPFERVQVPDAVDRITAWRDAAYAELRDRLEDGIAYDSADPMDDVLQAGKEAFMAVDERPDDVLAELHGYMDDAQRYAYEPFSGYPVGVALLDEQGRVFFGQNMEETDISHTLHGEENAFTTFATWGGERGDPVFLGVHSESPEEPFPCGMCEQTAAEFADPDMVIGAVGADGLEVEAYSTLGRHLPDMFRL